MPKPAQPRRSTPRRASGRERLSIRAGPLPSSISRARRCRREGSFADVARFAVAASSPVPNPDLIAYAATPAPGDVGCVDRAVLGKTGARYVHRAGAAEHALHVERLHHDRRERLERASDSDGSHRCAPLSRSRAGSTRERSSATSTTAARSNRKRSRRTACSATPRQLIVTDADVRTLRDTVYGWQDSVQRRRQSGAAADHADAVQSRTVSEPSDHACRRPSRPDTASRLPRRPAVRALRRRTANGPSADRARRPIAARITRDEHHREVAVNEPWQRTDGIGQIEVGRHRSSQGSRRSRRCAPPRSRRSKW